MAWGGAGTSSRPFFSQDLGLQIMFSENVRVCSLLGPLGHLGLVETEHWAISVTGTCGRGLAKVGCPQ